MRVCQMVVVGSLALASALATGAAHAAQPDPKSREIEALRKENELLKKESDLLRKEVELLKKELELLKGAGSDKTKPAKVTRDDVEYEFVSIKMDGNVGYMKLAITSQKAGKVLDTQGIRLFTADGTEHKAPLVGVITSNGLQTGRLTEGVRTVVEFKIGQVPADVKEFATIQLPGVFGGKGTGKGKLDNPVVLKGTFKVER